MKTIYRILAVVALLAVSVAPASAQFRMGVRAGMNVNKMHFNKSVFDSDNSTGFTAGVIGELMVPMLPIGFDLSLMYARHAADVSYTVGQEVVNVTKKADYIDIPLHFKWRLGLPLIGKIINPYIFTGPQVSLLLGKRNFDGFSLKRTEMAWNLGVGLQLVSHLQVSAN